jgi:hypothetical protein
MSGNPLKITRHAKKHENITCEEKSDPQKPTQNEATMLPKLCGVLWCWESGTLQRDNSAQKRK